MCEKTENERESLVNKQTLVYHLVHTVGLLFFLQSEMAVLSLLALLLGPERWLPARLLLRQGIFFRFC
mgnify:FL=1